MKIAKRTYDVGFLLFAALAIFLECAALVSFCMKNWIDELDLIANEYFHYLLAPIDPPFFYITYAVYGLVCLAIAVGIRRLTQIRDSLRKHDLPIMTFNRPPSP